MGQKGKMIIVELSSIVNLKWQILVDFPLFLSNNYKYVPKCMQMLKLKPPLFYDFKRSRQNTDDNFAQSEISIFILLLRFLETILPINWAEFRIFRGNIQYSNDRYGSESSSPARVGPSYNKKEKSDRAKWEGGGWVGG